MPPGSPGHAGNQITIPALTDHDAGIECRVGFEVPDRRKKLLVPGTKKDRPALFQQVLPVFFINDLQAEGQAVYPDKVIGKKNKGPGINKEL